MAENQKSHPKHSVLLIAPNRKKLVIFSFCLMVIIFSVMITELINQKSDWKMLILPVISLGFIGLLVPASEAWRYTSWQDYAERKEKIGFYREKKDKK